MAPYLGDGPCGEMPQPEPELRRIVDEINGLHDLACEASSAMYEFINRMRGPAPDAASKGENGVRVGGGTIGDLRRGIDETRERLGAILEMTRTLKMIA